MPQKTIENTLARTLAPDDIQVGRYIAILNEIKEYLFTPEFCTTGNWSDYIQPRLRWTTECTEPFIVRAVCLPFVLIEPVNGACRTLDVRQFDLVQLDDAYGREAFRRLADRPKKSAKRKNARKRKKNAAKST